MQALHRLPRFYRGDPLRDTDWYQFINRLPRLTTLDPAIYDTAQQVFLTYTYDTATHTVTTTANTAHTHRLR